MRFAVLFKVTLQHDYMMNLNSVVYEALPAQQQLVVQRQHRSSSYIDIFPTASTRSLLAGLGMLYKKLPSGFMVGIELEGTTTVPRRLPGPDMLLTFALRVIDPLFFNYSAGVQSQFYWFSNTTANEHEGQLFLSQAVSSHQASRAYRAGEIRSELNSGITSLFQAVIDTGPNAIPVAADWQRIPADTYDPTVSYQINAIVLQNNELYRALVNTPGTDLTDVTQWNNEGSLANQYTTRDDKVKLYPEVFNVDVSSAAATALELRITRPGGTLPVWQRRFESEQNLMSIQANLHGLKDGLYRLEVLDSAMTTLPALGFDFYLSQQALSEKWFGVVEIHPGLGNFALLDASGQLRSPSFELRFLNQAPRWRYLFPNTQPVGTGAEVAPDPADDRILVSLANRPLTRAGNGVRLRADDTTTLAVSEQILLPQPGAKGVKKLNNQWFSDVHLSNYPMLS